MKKLLAAFLSAMLIFSLCACGAGGASTSPPSSSSIIPTAISAEVADDGTAYIAVPDGNTVVINEETNSAMLSPDRNHIVVLLKDGTLYYSDYNQQEKTQISDSASAICYIRNDGFFYSDSNSKTYRVTFSDAAAVELGENIRLSVAENTLSTLYSTDTGNIYTMPYTSSEGTKVGTYSSSVYMEAISDDGQISVWTLKDNDKLTIILNEGDEKTTLGTVNYKYDYTNVIFTNDQNLVVITNTYGDQLYIKKRGEDVIKAKLGNTLYSGMVYTNMGELSQQATSKVDNLYVSVDSDTGSNVYCVTLTGDREQVLSKVQSFYISNGKILYVDSDSNLYCAKISGSTTVDDKKIASDVNIIEMSENGSYLYYMKDCSDNNGTLYSYKIGEDESKKVASDVGCYSSWSGYFQIGTDGSTVYYIKDIERAANTYIDYGVLFSWTYSAGESVKISSDVINRSLSSALFSGEINSKGFTYQKYSSVDSDKNVHVDLYYWNGTEGSKVASDVIW